MAAQHPDFALHLAEVHPGLWNWRVLDEDGQVALTGATTAKDTAYEQGELFRRYLCRFSADRNLSGGFAVARRRASDPHGRD